VLLLDIQMPGMGGLEVARHLAGLPTGPAVVFVTAHDRHAVEAFELNALDYLMKPVRATRLADALRKAAAAGAPPAQRLAQAAKGPREYLSVVERNRIVLVPVREIVYLRAELKYVTLRTRSGEHLIEEPLVALEAEFAEYFVRVHRSCLVARAAVRGFERAAEDGEEPHCGAPHGVDELPSAGGGTLGPGDTARHDVRPQTARCGAGGHTRRGLKVKAQPHGDTAARDARRAVIDRQPDQAGGALSSRS
jgi:hypothetical protein